MTEGLALLHWGRRWTRAKFLLEPALIFTLILLIGVKMDFSATDLSFLFILARCRWISDRIDTDEKSFDVGGRLPIGVHREIYQPLGHVVCCPFWFDQD